MSNKPSSGKVALVCGVGGFIGHHLAELKFPFFSESDADDF
jgi:hypothetical protein